MVDAPERTSGLEALTTGGGVGVDAERNYVRQLNGRQVECARQAYAKMSFPGKTYSQLSVNDQKFVDKIINQNVRIEQLLDAPSQGGGQFTPLSNAEGEKDALNFSASKSTSDLNISKAYWLTVQSIRENSSALHGAPSARQEVATEATGVAPLVEEASSNMEMFECPATMVHSALTNYYTTTMEFLEVREEKEKEDATSS